MNEVLELRSKTQVSLNDSESFPRFLQVGFRKKKHHDKRHTLINTVGCFGSEKEWIQDFIPIKTQVKNLDFETFGCLTKSPMNALKI